MLCADSSRFPPVQVPDGDVGVFCLCISISQIELEKKKYLPLGCGSEVISSLPKQIWWHSGRCVGWFGLREMSSEQVPPLSAVCRSHQPEPEGRGRGEE